VEGKVEQPLSASFSKNVDYPFVEALEEKYKQLSLFAQESVILEPEEKVAFTTAKVRVANITQALLQTLAANPSELYNLSPELFEELICDRLDDMGFSIHRVGHTYRKDGGIDIVAWPNNVPFPFIMAVQAKYHR
jgi:restriction endonuclease Mrr